MQKRLSTALGLVSAAIIAFQICLMQILSIVQWHHYAAMIIALALLGFGASGTCISLLRPWLLARFSYLLPTFLLFCGVCMVLAVGLSQSPWINFDAMLFFARPGSLWRLTLTCLIFFLPFFWGAMAIGLIFTRYCRDIGLLYGVNLAGSALGGILAVFLMWHFAPRSIPALIALLPVLAGIMLCARLRWAMAACLALLPVIWGILHPPELALSEFKALRKTLDLPGSKILTSVNSPYGFMQEVSSPVLRFAPGVSLKYQDKLPVLPVVFMNGDWFGPVPGQATGGQPNILDYATTALPYAAGKPGRVLVLDAGTGAHAAQALTHSAAVYAVEPNPFAAATMQKALGADARLKVFNESSRTFLMRETASYDLIVLPTIDAFGGTSGLYALKENHLLTIEAIEQMWERLTPFGMLSVSCWLDYPPRTSLKLIATLSEVVNDYGLPPQAHIIAVRNWGMLTVIVRREPFFSGDAALIMNFCDDLGFDPVLLPGLEPSRRVLFHGVQDTGWFSNIDTIMSLGWRGLSYDFNIRPATDNRPFFSQFLSRHSLERLMDLYGVRGVPFFEISYLILIISAIQISILAFVLIVLPLIKTGGRGKMRIFLYFGGIGIGYMFIEIMLIQGFILYLGIAVYAAVAVISAMLFFSGLGSWLSPRLRRVSGKIPAVIACLILLAIPALPFLFSLTISLPLAFRSGIMLLFLALPAFCMGLPFAAGISEIDEADVLWGWGVNGCLSVISTPLAAIIAVELGFAWVMLLAACAYGVSFLAFPSRP